MKKTSKQQAFVLDQKAVFPIAIGLVFVFLVLLTIGFLSEISQLKEPPKQDKVTLQGQPQAILSLEPQKATIKLGQTFAVGIRVEVSNGEATGAEAIIAFDPNLLEAVDGDKDKEGIQAVEAGFFDEYLGNKIDNQKGRAVISGLKMRERFSQGTIGTILFRAKKRGKAEIKFIFAPGEKGESDVAAPGGKDILVKTLGGEFTIK